VSWATARQLDVASQRRRFQHQYMQVSFCPVLTDLECANLIPPSRFRQVEFEELLDIISKSHARPYKIERSYSLALFKRSGNCCARGVHGTVAECSQPLKYHINRQFQAREQYLGREMYVLRTNMKLDSVLESICYFLKNDGQRKMA
jgi:hypothetical protein